MLLKGEGENADHIVGGAEWSSLSHDAFPAHEFDFMLIVSEQPTLYIVVLRPSQSLVGKGVGGDRR